MNSVLEGFLLSHILMHLVGYGRGIRKRYAHVGREWLLCEDKQKEKNRHHACHPSLVKFYVDKNINPVSTVMEPPHIWSGLGTSLS